MNNLCPQCGAPAQENATTCQYCGAAIIAAAPQAAPAAQQVPPTAPQQVVYVQNQINSERANWPVKSKIVAGILALLLGGLGIHKFYLGQAGAGVLYLLFCWTGIPAIIALIDGIIILTSNDENFQVKYRCRIN